MAKILLLVGACLLLSANTIPRYTKAQLTEKADLVAVVRVTQLHANAGERPCIAGSVLRIAKGHASGRIIICDNLIAELTPPAPAKGKLYKMYLSQTGQPPIFVPISHDAFKPLK